MSDATQELVVLGGAGLIAANVWFGGVVNFSDVVPFYTGKGGNATAAHQEMMMVLFGFAGVWVLSILAGISDGAGDAALAFVGGLWLLWLVERGKNPGGPFAHTSTGTKAAL